MKLLHRLFFSFIIAIASGGTFQVSAEPAVVVSIADQKLALVENGEPVAQFPVSTSKFGVGDRPGSYATPLGLLEVASKIGANAPPLQANPALVVLPSAIQVGPGTACCNG